MAANHNICLKFNACLQTHTTRPVPVDVHVLQAYSSQRQEKLLTCENDENACHNDVEDEYIHPCFCVIDETWMITIYPIVDHPKSYYIPRPNTKNGCFQDIPVNFDLSYTLLNFAIMLTEMDFILINSTKLSYVSPDTIRIIRKCIMMYAAQWADDSTYSLCTLAVLVCLLLFCTFDISNTLCAGVRQKINKYKEHTSNNLLNQFTGLPGRKAKTIQVTMVQCAMQLRKIRHYDEYNYKNMAIEFIYQNILVETRHNYTGGTRTTTSDLLKCLNK
jgi:hypothetical protein